MQPGYPGSGQEPYGTQPPYRDPYAQPHYSSAPPDERNTPAPEDDEKHGAQSSAHPAQPVPEQRTLAPRPAPATTDPTANPHANTLGLIAMVLGVLSIPSAFCTPLGMPIAVVFGAAGIVLGTVGLRQVRHAKATNRGQCVAGLVAGIVGLLAALAAAAALAYSGAT